MNKELEIWVLECDLLVADKATDTKVILFFCLDCEFHGGFDKNPDGLFVVKCNYEK